MHKLLISSLLIELGVVPFALLAATLAGFALGHLRPPGSRWIFLAFILGLTLPFEGIIVPLYYQMRDIGRSEEHTSELHHVAISYAVFCLKKKKKKRTNTE